MEDMIEELRRELMEQLAAKREMLEAEREYDEMRAATYLQYADEGHYKALNKTTVDERVMEARKRYDDSRLYHYALRVLGEFPHPSEEDRW